ncbi:hypothetical protein NDU88_007929 [Pleurodeles waltl]|uniref:Uncharacterized protein n=1 Tax=Pleurodeles waltl TaxID=8319 RepID=A0AAV7NW95_PLEWA|nr:hypothetical protein NDU88_007929 [Pleurodeles waltl]
MDAGGRQLQLQRTQASMRQQWGGQEKRASMRLPAKHCRERRCPRASREQATPTGAAPVIKENGGRVAVIAGVREEDFRNAQWLGGSGGHPSSPMWGHCMAPRPAARATLKGDSEAACCSYGLRAGLFRIVHFSFLATPASTSLFNPSLRHLLVPTTAHGRKRGKQAKRVKPPFLASFNGNARTPVHVTRRNITNPSASNAF